LSFYFVLFFQTLSIQIEAPRSHGKQQLPSTSGSRSVNDMAPSCPSRLNLPGRGPEMEGFTADCSGGVWNPNHPRANPPEPSRPRQDTNAREVLLRVIHDAGPRDMGLSDRFWVASATQRRRGKTPTCAMILGRSALDPSRQILTNPRFSSSTASLLQSEEGFTRATTLRIQVAHES